MEFKQSVDDRRTGVRLNFHVQVSVLPEKMEHSYQGVSDNVSVSGLVFKAELPPTLVKTPCSVNILFPGSHSNLVIQGLAATLVRVEEREAAVAFDKPLEWFLLFPVYQRKLAVPENKSLR